MIIIIEGAQGSGKTHLVNSIKRNILDVGYHIENKEIIFYKYKHVEYMKKLNFEDIEPDESFHYFTLSNTLTILSLQELTLSDKIFIFDRGIFSAYVWSILRKRKSTRLLKKELTNLLELDIYNNCHVIRVKTDIKVERDHTDIFDKHTNTVVENNIFDELFDINNKHIINKDKNNSYTEVINTLDKLSEVEMFQAFKKIVNKN